MNAWWLQIIVTSIPALIASSGFWAYIHSREKRKDATSRLLMGLAYDKIMTLGMSYIERGWISEEEFEDFNNYLYRPYKDAGGNGVADRIMAGISSLPLRKIAPIPTPPPKGRREIKR